MELKSFIETLISILDENHLFEDDMREQWDEIRENYKETLLTELDIVVQQDVVRT